MDAMETITGRAAIKPPSFVPAPKEEKPKHLLLPQAAPDNRAMVDYLKKRGIDPGVIDYCIQTGRLYESRNKGHSNVVFVGFDKEGKARFGCLRGIGEGRFHGDLSGSDKHYSFALPACVENPAVHLCESAIDVMSYATLCKLDGIDWRRHNLLEWCACFVSWCANECGYIEAGIIPKFAACASQGVPWFQERGLWQDNSYEPRPGDIIFFDWDDGGQDGSSDHVGIVEKVENGRVYTIEGNSGDTCRQNSYPIGYYEIYGYGTPAY